MSKIFYKTIRDLGVKPSVVTFKDFAEKSVAIDAYNEIYRTSTVGYVAGLTNPAGQSTMHIRSILSNVIKMKNLGIRAIWIFDSKEPVVSKEETVKNRKEVKLKKDEEIVKTENEIKEIESEYSKLDEVSKSRIKNTVEKQLNVKRETLEKLKSQNPSYSDFARMKKDVIQILEGMGIEYSFAPSGYDGECIASQMNKRGVVDAVISSDSDVFPYGAKYSIKKIIKQSGKYELYSRNDILKTLDINEKELIEVAVALGTDFNFKNKLKGAGKRVVKMIKNNPDWNEGQLNAIDIFKRADRVELPKIITPKSDIEGLKKWLVESQGFNPDRLGF